MTGDQALAELLDVSEDIAAAVLLDADGGAIASSVGEDAANQAAEIASAMLAYGDALRTGTSARRLEAMTAEGSVFLVREGARAVVAATGRDPVAGLVYHDLGAVLRRVKPRAREKANAPA